jgi:hypothetical protein
MLEVLREQLKSSMKDQEDLVARLRRVEGDVLRITKERDFEQSKSKDLERLLELRNRGIFIYN